MTTDEFYMARCLQLAVLGQAAVAPNPMVGAVLVYEGRVIGEGYHAFYGGPHAEVNCLASVSSGDQQLVKDSILYVSLEPCAHFGKTPPCANFIVNHGIKEVVVATGDPFAPVNGRGIEILREAGIKVRTGILEEEAQNLNKCFFTFHEKKRPYIILKWAQTSDGFISGENYRSVRISSDITDRWVHKLRSHTQAIMVGTNTSRHDNPSLTTRLWTGKNPLRIVIDKQLTLSQTSALFTTESPVLVLNYLKDEAVGHIRYLRLNSKDDLLSTLMTFLKNENISSLLVEGGSILLKSFIGTGLWDEAIIVTNKQLRLGKGTPAVEPPRGFLSEVKNLGGDEIKIFKNFTA